MTDTASNKNAVDRGGLRLRVDRAFIENIDQLCRYYQHSEGKLLDRSAALRRVVLEADVLIGQTDKDIMVPIVGDSSSKLYYLYDTRNSLSNIRKKLAETRDVNVAMISEAEALRSLVYLKVRQIEHE